MSYKSKIEWTEATWNPIAGCTKCSPGCENCYAERMSYRLMAMERGRLEDEIAGKYSQVVDNRFGGWNGRIYCDEFALKQPLHWRKPRRIFVCSMSDLFQEKVPFDFIDKVFGVIEKCPHHTFQILTKRAKRMAKYFKGKIQARRIVQSVARNTDGCKEVNSLPLSNLHLGVSISNQAEADEKIPILLQIHAAVQWLSIEPMLGPIDLLNCNGVMAFGGSYGAWIDGVVVGGESGPGARPMHPDWVRSIRDQCVAADVPFFFKQWGNWIPGKRLGEIIWDSTHEASSKEFRDVNNSSVFQFPDGQYIFRSRSKKTAGRILDGREWNEYPERS